MKRSSGSADGRSAQALATLPDPQRQVLEMAYFQAYTQAQIAEELGIPIGTVKTRTLAAMRKLRRGALPRGLG